MSLDALIEFGAKDETWHDMYSLFRFMFESELNSITTDPPFYYFERVEAGFQRPSFLIKTVTGRPIPYNYYLSWYEHAVQVSFFSEDLFECQYVMSSYQKLLTGFRDVILPRYDFSVSPPLPISVSGRNADGQLVPSAMGTRIMPDTVNARLLQEPDDRWQSVITFNMRSPRLSERHCNVLESVEATHIGPPSGTPLVISQAEIKGDLEVEQ